MKKKAIIISVVLLILCSIIGIYYLLSKSDNTKEESLTEIETEEISESDINENENITEEMEDDNVDDVQDDEVSTTELTTEKSSIKAKTSSKTTSTRSTTKSKTTKQTTTSTTTSQTTTTTTESSYIGVPDPNSFFYSIHQGKIEYKTRDECMDATAEVGFKDTVDIINLVCLDVVDGEGTTLGYYMYVNCTSGNCDRYKS